MPKPRLKLVEPSLSDQLEAAIGGAAAAHEAWQSAAAKLREQFPGDHRVISGDLAGTVLVDAERIDDDPAAGRESMLVAYRREREKVSDLQQKVREADKVVEQLRAGVQASVTEVERRAALAAAIAEAGQVEAALQNLRGAVGRADNAVADAQERHGGAAKAVTAASEANAKLFEAAIEQGHPPAHDSTMRDARRAADDVADELAVAKNAAAAMRAKLGGAEQQLNDARATVMSCARCVAASAIPRLLEEAQAMQRELEARRQVLSVLSDHDGAGLGAIVNDYLSSPVFPFEQSGERPSDHPAAEPWLSIIDQLVCDAAAPLPVN